MVTKQVEDYLYNHSFPITVQRGKKYYDEGKIRRLSQKGKGEWRAVAVGSEANIYHVQLTVHERDGVPLDYHCSCQAFAAYPGLCKHLVGTIYEWAEHAETVSQSSHIQPPQASHRDTAKVNRFIQSFADLYEEYKEELLERETLQVEYFIHIRPAGFFANSGFVELEMKLGGNRTYVVKDIDEWLNAYEQKRSLTFTKNFTYDPLEHRLTPEDEKIMSFLGDLKNMRQEPRYRYSGSKERTKYIPGPSLRPLLELLQYTNVQMVKNSDEEHHKGIEVRDRDFPLHFRLQAKEQHYELDWENGSEVRYLGEDYRAFVIEHTFYMMNEQEQNIFSRLYKRMKRENDTLVIPKDSFEMFCSYVLPQVNQLAEVKIKEEVKEELTIDSLRASLYVEEQEGKLLARTIFSYGRNQVDPYSDQHLEGHDSYVMRDIKKENEVMARIERIPFTYNEQGLMLKDEADIAAFLMEDLQDLSKVMDVYLTDAVQSFVFSPKDSPSLDIAVNQSMNWLDINFQFAELGQEEAEALLQAMLERRSYHRLQSGAFINLQEDVYQGISSTLEKITPPGTTPTQEMTAPLYKAFQLEEDQTSVTFTERLEKLVEDISNPENLEVTPPAHLEGTLREYQKTGFRWLTSLAHYGFGGILADEMGLGKTIQAISVIAHEVERNPQTETLVVAPASLIYNWKKELELYAPELKVAVIHGTKTEREGALAQEAHVFITSYPSLQRDEAMYFGRMFNTLIVDEAQYLKNDRAKTTRAVQSVQKKHAFALSGTPVENRSDELFSLFSVVMPDLFPVKRKFKQLSNDDISKRVQPFIMRRLKTQVLEELPEKQENVQYTELTQMQKQLYVAQVEQISNELQASVRERTFSQNRFQILAGLTRLRQICCHPQLVMDDAKPDSSGKLEFLSEYVRSGLVAGRRMVIFSQFTSMLSIIREHFDEQGWEYYYLDGGTPVSDRLKIADAFNAGEKNLFLISLRAGGTGLNLTGGDTVILYDLWWNPAVEQQAADRVHRFGQKKQVQIVRLVTSGTIEEKIIALQEEKKTLVDDLIQPGETLLETLQPEDIQSLLDTSMIEQEG
ncbi:SNF2 family DNA or RNA helicase [Geomicrobium halophilum]|uniref:SNF2 family DNA or RNA helicase n=1 Tax=Geomicrobium halophilum TaxID=549000 RepID=A0A841PHV6_9BACL|nr:DEAD/DEAH box helicase [Geomicrobium halophilum]MBB6448370.1 SNF2 family DNA or RNA helicase [Geomicrobium halophilum]